MKYFYLLVLSFIVLSCKTTQSQLTNKSQLKFAKTITAKDLNDYLTVFSSDEFEGRETGTEGQKKAANYLKNFYSSLNIKGGDKDDTPYFQEISTSYFNNRFGDSENVIAMIEGSEMPNEYLILTSHYDHEGIKNGKIYNGADDDGSGTVAIMEIAQAFKEAINKGFEPKRSIIFMHVTAEEKGLLGSKYYSEHPIYPLNQTIANLNIDMIGRKDKAHENNDNYVYLIGSNRLSTELHEISETTNSKFTNLELDYTFNAEDDPNRFYYRSDHYNFAKHDIPIIFYFNGVHEDYHKPTDTSEKIEYELLAKRAKLIFHTAWELVNRDNRPIVDQPTK